MTRHTNRKNYTRLIAFPLTFLLIGWGSYYLFIAGPDYNSMNPAHRYLTQRILVKWEDKINSLPEATRALVDYDDLLGTLNFLEKSWAEKILAINPQELGFKGPFFSKEKATNLVAAPPVTLSVNGKTTSTGIQYCPEHSYKDFLAMMAAMEQELGKRLYIDSAYRSPGRQAYLFFHYLVKNHHYSLRETAKWVALPGYSEHGNPRNNAIDFINGDGINGENEGQTAADFAKLPEYHWLRENAAKFNFFLTYPPDNQWGVTYEPWHWHWEKPDTQ
jgi:hypothetical protein